MRCAPHSDIPRTDVRLANGAVRIVRPGSHPPGAGPMRRWIMPQAHTRLSFRDASGVLIRDRIP